MLIVFRLIKKEEDIIATAAENLCGCPEQPTPATHRYFISNNIKLVQLLRLQLLIQFYFCVTVIDDCSFIICFAVII